MIVTFNSSIARFRLERIDNGEVTFRYRDNRSEELRHVTITGINFIRQFLQHVLPRGCAKVRYYGIWSGSCHQSLHQAFALLNATSPDTTPRPVSNEASELQPSEPRQCARCPHCKIGQLIEIEVIHRQRRRPP